MLPARRATSLPHLALHILPHFSHVPPLAASLGCSHSIRVQLLVSYGFPTIAAGAHIATNDAVAIGALPLFAALSTYVGLRPMLLAIPLLILASAGGLVQHTSWTASSDELDAISGAAIQVMQLMELFAPIIPLALMPRNTGKLGSAYGSGESVFVVVQMSIALLLGAVRTFSGFQGAMAIICCGAATAFAVAVPLFAWARDVATVGLMPPPICSY